MESTDASRNFLSPRCHSSARRLLGKPTVQLFISGEVKGTLDRSRHFPRSYCAVINAGNGRRALNELLLVTVRAAQF
jgi:hypothetical protein